MAASAVSGRCVYAGVVEHSVYVHPAARGRGIGRRLLDALIASTEAAGIWTIQSGIFPENTASLALHQAAGFRVVGTRERIGQHHGRWRDVVLIERRSPAVLPVPARTGRSSRALRPSRAALAVMATATAHLAAGSAASTPMIMKASSAAVPSAPGRARPADGRYRVLRAAKASSATTATSARPGHEPDRHRDRPGPRAAGDQRNRPAQPHHRPDRQQPAGGPAGRVRAGELRRDQLRVAELRPRRPRRRSGSQAQAQVPPVGFLQPVGQFLHHRARQWPASASR